MSDARTFEYRVWDQDGKVVKGRLDATNEAAVANRLRTMGMAPLAIDEVRTSGLQREITIPGLGDKISLKDLAIMSRQLATMISAGLSLLRALSILAEQTGSKALAKVLTQTRGDVETGSALSESFGRHGAAFPPLMINMIRAGEVGGFLEKALLSVAQNLESEVRLRAQIRSAMTYPVMVLVLAVVAVIGMLLFIVPVFEDMFAGLGGTLPWPTRVLVAISDWMAWVAPIGLLAALALSFWWRKHRHDPTVRSRVEPALLRVPVFGPLVEKVAIARFTRNLGTMLGAGVPILLALDVVGRSSGNWAIEQAVRGVRDGVRAGRSLAAPLAEHPVFPPMVVQMIATGEDAGAVEPMLAKISDFYDDEVRATTAQLTSLIEPLMIAVLGVVIGGMVVALYLPIFSASALVG